MDTTSEPLGAGFRPLPEWTQPLVWTPQGKRPVYRFVAHLLIRLLVLTPMPAECQAWAFLFPSSLLWSLTPPSISPDAPAGPQESGASDPADPATSPLTERPGEFSCGVADPVGVERLVSFTDPTQPRVTGRIESIGGRIAFGENGSILFGTAYKPWGGDDPLGGVKVAALGAMAIIAGVKDDPAVLALDRKTAEPQQIKYRVIPKDQEVQTSELEVVVDDTVVRTLPAPLTGGQGEVTLAAGLQHPSGQVVKARLIVNRSTGELPATEKTLRGELFTIRPTEPATIQAWGEPLDILAFNKAMLGRLQPPRDPPYQAPTLTWASIGAPNAVVAPPSEAPKSGVYSTTMSSTGRAGSAHQFELRQGATVLGRTTAITVIPGPAADALLSADRGGSPILVPADGTTVLNLTLENVHDESGNPAADGTPVSWRVAGDGGELFEVSPTLTGGRATARYRAGIEPEPISIVAEVDGLEKSLSLKQEPLETTLTPDGAFIDVVVSSAAGVPADQTKVEWSTLYGEVKPADDPGTDVVLVNGRARGRWVPFNRPGDPKYRTIEVFSSIGRSRGSTKLDRRDVESLPPGPSLSLDSERLMGDRTTTYVTQPGPEGLSVPAQTTVHVEGATPGVAVKLFLGSPRLPVHEPIAAYGFDVVEQPAPDHPDDPATTPDIYGGARVTLGAGVEIDTGERWYGMGSLRFAPGSQGAVITDLPPQTSNFGFNGFVRFDAPAAGQKVIEKAGSYALAVVEQGGAPRLEFAVTSGGSRRSIVSTEVLAPETWYQFAAHFRDGQLILQVGDTEPVQTADVGGPADASTSPLTLGVDLEGRLDAVKVFDFTKTPLFTFGNGQTVVEVIPDVNGAAQVQLVSSGVFYAPPGYEAVGVPGQMWLGLGQDPRQIVAEAQFRAWSERQFTTGCLDALKTGEPDTVLGFACEVGAGFIPGVGVAQGIRDFYFTAKRFVKSKKTKKDYLVATVGVSLALVAIIPGAKAVKSLVKAKAAIEVSETAGRLVTRELEKQTEKAVLGEAADYVAEKSVLSLFDEAAAPATRQAAIELAESFKNPQAARVALDRIAVTFGPELLVTTLNRLRGKFTKELVERLVMALDKMPQLSSAGKLSEEALEGMLVFLQRTNADARLGEIWGVIRGVQELNLVDHFGAMKHTFELIREADAVGAKDLMNVLNQLKNKGLGLETFKGALNHLDEAAAVGWSKIKSMDRAMPGYYGRPDLLVQDGTRLLEIEIKNLEKGAKHLSSADYQQLSGKIKAAIDRARDAAGDVNPAALTEELRNLQYRIRGVEKSDYGPLFRDDFYKTAADWLALELDDSFRSLAKSIGLFFSGRRLPL